MSTANRQLLVKSWPNGLPTPDDFEIVETPLPVPGDAQILIRNLWLSIDPYYRHSLGPRFVGTKFCHPGDVMMGVTLGQVVRSHDPLVPVGPLCHHAPGRNAGVHGGRRARRSAVAR